MWQKYSGSNSNRTQPYTIPYPSNLLHRIGCEKYKVQIAGVVHLMANCCTHPTHGSGTGTKAKPSSRQKGHNTQQRKVLQPACAKSFNHYKFCVGPCLCRPAHNLHTTVAPCFVRCAPQSANRCAINMYVHAANAYHVCMYGICMFCNITANQMDDRHLQNY